MKALLRTAAVLACGLATNVASAQYGPISDVWNSVFYPGYSYGYGYSPGYTTYYAASPVYSYSTSYVPSYSASYAPSYGYGVSYGSACCSTCCSPCCNPCCVGCSSCGSAGYGCSTCAGGNCVAVAPSTRPVPDSPPRSRTFEEPYDGEPGEGDPGFEPRGTDGEEADFGEEREAQRPGASAIPQKKPAPTPEPAVDADEPAVSPRDLDHAFVWTAAPVRTRVDVRARFGDAAIARTRVAPEDVEPVVPVSTQLAAKK